jgi:hypothetical protein
MYWISGDQIEIGSADWLERAIDYLIAGKSVELADPETGCTARVRGIDPREVAGNAIRWALRAYGIEMPELVSVTKLQAAYALVGGAARAAVAKHPGYAAILDAVLAVNGDLDEPFSDQIAAGLIDMALTDRARQRWASLKS